MITKFYWANNDLMRLYKKSGDDKILFSDKETEWFNTENNTLYYVTNYKLHECDFSNNDLSDLPKNALYTLTSIFLDMDVNTEEDEFRNYNYDDIVDFIKNDYTDKIVIKNIIINLFKWNIQNYTFDAHYYNTLNYRRNNLLEIVKNKYPQLYKELKMELVLGKGF